MEARRLWSVTTLIKAGLGVGEALVGWSAKVTAQRAYDDLEVLAAYSLKGKRADAVKWLTEARWQNREGDGTWQRGAQDRGGVRLRARARIRT